jgi:uncharacterized protein YeaO (DUF488 family)
MAMRVVRLGSPRQAGEGLRLGTVSRTPRGVRAQDYARRNYFDLWLPELAPEPGAVRAFLTGDRKKAWPRLARAYERRMKEPAARRLIRLLAALSRATDFSVGCYCEDESLCHRSILRGLFEKNGAKIR